MEKHYREIWEPQTLVASNQYTQQMCLSICHHTHKHTAFKDQRELCDRVQLLMKFVYTYIDFNLPVGGFGESQSGLVCERVCAHSPAAVTEL